MNIDPKILALAKPKEVDLTKFNVTYGGQNMTVNDLILYLVSESASSGTRQNTGLIECDGIQEAFSTTQMVIVTLAMPNDIKPRFVMNNTLQNGITVSASCNSIVFLEMPIDVKVLFVFNDGEVEFYVSATIL